MRGSASSFASYYFPLVILHRVESFARSREHTRSEGEIKERRQLLQLITDLAAIVFWLVSSKSSDAPLGKMRGLITVKLANEQVNYGATFLCKKCHFSERCYSSRAESLKQAVREDGVGQEERPRTNRSFPISLSRKVSGFRNCELRSAAFQVERKRLRQWAFFFSRGNFFPLPFPLTQETASAPLLHSSFLPSFPLIAFHLYTSVEPLGHPRFFSSSSSSSFSVLQRACMKNKFLSHHLKFARTFVRVELKLKLF